MKEDSIVMTGEEAASRQARKSYIGTKYDANAAYQPGDDEALRHKQETQFLRLMTNLFENDPEFISILMKGGKLNTSEISAKFGESQAVDASLKFLDNARQFLSSEDTLKQIMIEKNMTNQQAREYLSAKIASLDESRSKVIAKKRSAAKASGSSARKSL